MYVSQTNNHRRMKSTEYPSLTLHSQGCDILPLVPPPQCSVCSLNLSVSFCLCKYPLIFLCPSCAAPHNTSQSILKPHISVPVEALSQATTPQAAASLSRKLTNISFVQSQLRNITIRNLENTLFKLDDFSRKITDRIRAVIENAKARVIACKSEIERVTQNLEKLKYSFEVTPKNVFERVALYETSYEFPFSTLYDCFESHLSTDFLDSALNSLFSCKLTYTDVSSFDTPRTPSTAVQTPRKLEDSPIETTECVFCKISLQAMFTAGFEPISLECSHAFHNKACFLRFLQQNYLLGYKCPSCETTISEGVVDRWVDRIDMEKVANRLLKQCKRCKGMGVLQGLECGHSYCKDCCGVVRRGKERCAACVETEELIKNIAF